ncbi:MAG: hypothetical protein JZU49_01020, partial [Sulfuricurvum sp.]|nr:hypothetical protein [Sulfuricurvum sp.]
MYQKNVISPLIKYGEALGQDNLVEGNRSIAIGQSNNTKSYLEIVCGVYATAPSDQNATEWVPADRLFTVGNGLGDSLRNDALTIYKSGYSVFTNSILVGDYDHRDELGFLIDPENGTLRFTTADKYQFWDVDHWASFGGGSGITGSGTPGYLPKFTGATEIGDSPVYTDGTNVGIGTNTLTSSLVINNTTAYSGSNGKSILKLQQSGTDIFNIHHNFNIGSYDIVEMGLGNTGANWLRLYAGGIGGSTNRMDLNASNGIFLNGIVYPQNNVILTRTGDDSGIASSQKNSYAISFQAALVGGDRISKIYHRASTLTNNLSYLSFIIPNSSGVDQEYLTLSNDGYLGIGQTSPTAYLHIKAGTATANTAPLKFTSGILLTTPENGAFEFDGTHYYGTIGTTRYQLDQQTYTLPVATASVLGGVKEGNGVTIKTDGTLSSIIQATTATAIATAAKTATIADYTLKIGDFIALTLTSGNSAAAMTLAINGGA